MITYKLNQYGLREKDMEYMLKLFSKFPEVEKVVLYGSRAGGHHEHGSDVDLALFGSRIPFTVVADIHHLLEEESPTLLWFDVVHFDSLKNEKLKSQISQQGKVLYQIN